MDYMGWAILTAAAAVGAPLGALLYESLVASPRLRIIKNQYEKRLSRMRYMLNSTYGKLPHGVVNPWQERMRQDWEGFVAMRNTINEYVPMPSLESDLRHGPEMSVSYAAVAEAIIGHVRMLQARHDHYEALYRAGMSRSYEYKCMVEHAEKVVAELSGEVARLANELNALKEKKQ